MQRQPPWWFLPWRVLGVARGCQAGQSAPEKHPRLFLAVSGRASLCSPKNGWRAPNVCRPSRFVCTVTFAACCSQFGISACLHLSSIPHVRTLGRLFLSLMFLARHASAWDSILFTACECFSSSKSTRHSPFKLHRVVVLSLKMLTAPAVPFRARCLAGSEVPHQPLLALAMSTAPGAI